MANQPKWTRPDCDPTLLVCPCAAWASKTGQVARDLYAGSDQDRIDLEALRSEITGGDCRWPPMARVLVDGMLVSIEARLARARGEG